MAQTDGEEFKKKGNECMKNGKFIEAMLHYSQALQQTPTCHLLLSNRSLAFLKMDQHYHAMQDAVNVIHLQPDWPKGYFRKGEVEFKSEHFEEAVSSYKRGLQVEPNDTGLQGAYKKASTALKEQRKSEWRIPYIGVFGALFFAALIVIGDEFVAKEPSLKYIWMKMLVCVIIGSFGYSVAVAYRYLVRSQRQSLLDEPIDLFSDGNSEKKEASTPNVTNPKAQHKSGASGARQRYKKGKS